MANLAILTGTDAMYKSSNVILPSNNKCGWEMYKCLHETPEFMSTTVAGPHVLQH